MNIAFQGCKGAYSEQAIARYYPTAMVIAKTTFEDILQAVADSSADYAMLPVENTLGGTVLPACQALIASGLSPVAEHILPIHHMLMAPASIGTIKTALSHPQALAQCQDHLKQLNIKAEAFFDTAGAAEHIAKYRPANTAAIASALAAQHYQLEILQSNFEDKPFNQTRFFLIGRTAEPTQSNTNYKTSLTFTLPNQPNALASVLSLLGTHQINLSKIESHPTREKAWEYWFFADMMGHAQQQPLATALAEIRPLLLSLNVIGSYRIE